MYFAEMVVAATGVTLSLTISAITSNSFKLVLFDKRFISGNNSTPSVTIILIFFF